MTALAALWGMARTPFGAAILFALALVAGLYVIDRRARSDEAARIEAKLDAKARKSIDEAHSGIDDVRHCAADGGVWDGARGTCDRRLRRDGP